MSHSKSYNVKSCCGAHCGFYNDDNPEQPCWGPVQVTDETEGWFVHYCQGHLSYTEDGIYIKEPNA